MSRGSSRNAADYRDQLAERNSLLQHVYQTVEKIVGTEKVCRSWARQTWR